MALSRACATLLGPSSALVPPRLARRLAAQLCGRLSASLFERVMAAPCLCTAERGLALKMLCSAIEDWLRPLASLVPPPQPTEGGDTTAEGGTSRIVSLREQLGVLRQLGSVDAPLSSRRGFSAGWLGALILAGVPERTCAYRWGSCRLQLRLLYRIAHQYIRPNLPTPSPSLPLPLSCSDVLAMADKSSLNQDSTRHTVCPSLELAALHRILAQCVPACPPQLLTALQAQCDAQAAAAAALSAGL